MKRSHQKQIIASLDVYRDRGEFDGTVKSARSCLTRARYEWSGIREFVIAWCNRPLPVVIRYEGKGKATRSDWHLSDIVAIFPTEPGDGPTSMTCYSTLGQHSSCATNYVGARTQPATPQQVRAMLRELRRIGYKHLRVVSRASSHHATERRREWYRPLTKAEQFAKVSP